MGYIARLTYNGKKLDLDGTDRFALAAYFVPPATPVMAMLAAGTSANRRRGSEKISERALDIEMVLPVYITGASDAEVRQGRYLLASFLNNAGQHPYNPVEFQYRGDDAYSFEPVWGQGGAFLRFEITHADSPRSWSYVGIGDMRKNKELVEIRCTIRPYAHGKEQRLASATGGVIEDKIGKADGISRGLIVPQATTNKMTNPIFGHGTYDNGWTTGSDLQSSANYDPEYVLFGDVSAKLVADGATNRTFTQSINVGNTNTHQLSCYAKLENGGTVSNSILNLYYGGSVTETYTSMGDGWYRIVGEVTGVSAGTTTGVILTADYTIYVDGFQIEEKSVITPLCHGDLLGCSWSGTAHASTSTRTQAVAKVDVSDILNTGEGTFRIAMRMNHNEADISSDIYLFAVNATNDMRALYNDTQRDWEFNDGTNQLLSTSNASWTPGDYFILHFTYGPDGLVIYEDGAANGSTASFTPPDTITDLYIGDAVATGAGIEATIMDFAVFDRAMTATEVSDDYDNISQVILDDYRLGAIPWFWTEDGDNILDNADDSSHTNWGVIDGIPGTAPATIKFEAETTESDFEFVGSLWIGVISLAEFIDVSTYLYDELSGTANVAYSGGEYEQISVNGTNISRYANSWGKLSDNIEGKEVYALVCLADASADTIGVRTQILVGGVTLSSDYKYYTTTTFRQLYRGPSISIPSTPKINPIDYIQIQLGAGIIRPSGTQNVNFDFTQIMARPMARFYFTGGGSPGDTIFYDGQKVYDYVTSSGQIGGQVPVFGDDIVMLPDLLNIVHVIQGDNADVPGLSYTLTMSNIRTIPRWGMA